MCRIWMTAVLARQERSLVTGSIPVRDGACFCRMSTTQLESDR